MATGMHSRKPFTTASRAVKLLDASKYFQMENNGTTSNENGSHEPYHRVEPPEVSAVIEKV